jgi:RNA polymerase sigma factor (TIGR02999 family)
VTNSLPASPLPRAALSPERDRLFSALYRDLRSVAERELRRAGRPAALSPTTILHETWLAMRAREGAFPDHSRFLAYASKAMRGLIIDVARERSALKRGGGLRFTTLDSDLAVSGEDAAELAALGDALERLAEVDERLVRVVDLRFFCGFSFAEIAATLGVSERTAQRDWDKARILLHRLLRD